MAAGLAATELNVRILFEQDNISLAAQLGARDRANKLVPDLAGKVNRQLLGSDPALAQVSDSDKWFCVKSIDDTTSTAFEVVV